ncbi:MAG: arylsulfatase [Verrucomicrobiota bacterium]
MISPRAFLFILLAVSWASCAVSRAADRPNIVLIMSDDMGYSDLGCYGGEIGTPNLDALAAGGLRFTQFYNGARCCPTRASLLTGLYPHQAGMGFMVREVKGAPGYAGDLSRQAVTIAEVLRAGGYRTAMSGKWHVARSHAMKDTTNWPVQRGFDRFYGTLRGFGSFYDPDTLTRQNTFITPENDPEYKPSGEYYYTDAITDNAITFLRDNAKDTAKQKDPFFLYVAYTAAHWPLQAPEKDIAKYRGKYDGGYDAIRQARLERLKKLGLVDPKWAPTPTIGKWDEVQDKAWEARCMETYAAMIDNMDQGIGRIVAQLKQDGRLDNTLVIYLQDNGACAERNGRTPVKQPAPKDLKPMGKDELQTKSGPPMQTRDGPWVRSGPGVMAGPADTWIGYGEAWANVANTPFREYKHWAHEGGIATPLIAHWPKGIAATRRGKLEPQVGNIIDIMATCVDLSGAKYPAEFNGQKIKPLEGVSLAPAFSGGKLARKAPIFWEHESNRAVRDGQWKLVAMEDAPWELYDMTADRTEMRNVAAQHPDKVRELSAAWDAWAKRSDVLPLGSWKPVWGTPGK